MAAIDRSQQPWGGSHSRAIRSFWLSRLPQPCGQCGQPVTRADEWVVGHIESRGARPELTYRLDNTRPEHRRCSDKTATQGIKDKARADVLRELGLDPDGQPTGRPAPLGRAQRRRSSGGTPSAEIDRKSVV